MTVQAVCSCRRRGSEEYTRHCCHRVLSGCLGCVFSCFRCKAGILHQSDTQGAKYDVKVVAIDVARSAARVKLWKPREYYPQAERKAAPDSSAQQITTAGREEFRETPTVPPTDCQSTYADRPRSANSPLAVPQPEDTAIIRCR